MRSMFKWLVAAIAMVGLAAGSAMAQQAEFSGKVEVSAGRLATEEADSGGTTDEDDESWSQLPYLNGEGDLYINASAGDFSANVEIEGSDTGGASVGHMLNWNASPQLTIQFTGHSSGVAYDDAPSDVANWNAPIGRNAANVGSGSGLVNLEFAAGVATVGLALEDGCTPGCGIDTTAADRSTRTLVIHGRGSQGPLSFKLAVYQASGLLDEHDGTDIEDVSVSGGGNHIGVGFDGGQFAIGFDYATTTLSGVDEELTDAAGNDLGAGSNPGQEEDESTTKMSLSVQAAGATLIYYQEDTESVDAAKDVSFSKNSIYVDYKISPTDGVTMGPEFATQSEVTTDDSGAETTEDGLNQQWIGFGIDHAF